MRSKNGYRLRQIKRRAKLRGAIDATALKRKSRLLVTVELAAIVSGIFGLFVALYAVWLTLQEMRWSRFEREQEGLARAWSLLTTKSSGNSGKPGAMRYLHANGQSLDGVDLSCSTMGGTEVQPDGNEVCLRPTNLNFLSLSFEEFGEPAPLWDADLSGVSLVRADLSWASIVRADLGGSLIENSRLPQVIAIKANFRQARLIASDFSEGRFTLANFTDAKISSQFCGASFAGANLTRSEWHGGDAVEAYFSGADFSASTLTNYNFFASDFSDLEKEVKFDGAVIENVSFQNASLSGASFRGTLLRDVDFDGANIAAADFTSAELLGSTDLSKAWIFDDQKPPVGLPPDVEINILSDREGGLPQSDPIQYRAMRTGSFIPEACFAIE